MLIVPDLLSRQELRAVLAALPDERFADGAATAAGAAKAVKRNEEYVASIAEDPAAAIVDAAIRRHPAVQNALYPRKLYRILFNRYAAGMAYGDHFDAPLMDHMSEQRLRTDQSMTLFLSAPESYEGGELVIQHALGESRVKLPAGAAVFYRSLTLHRVEPVTRGVRLAAVTWIQSHVKGEEQRAILHDLALGLNLMADGPGRRHILGAYARLLQRWSEN